MVTWEGGGNVCCRGVGYSWVAPGEVSSLTGSMTQSWLENVRLVSLKECFFCPDVVLQELLYADICRAVGFAM